MSVCECQCVQQQWEELEGNSGNSIALLTALRSMTRKRRSQRKSFFIFFSLSTSLFVRDGAIKLIFVRDEIYSFAYYISIPMGVVFVVVEYLFMMG